MCLVYVCFRCVVQRLRIYIKEREREIECKTCARGTLQRDSKLFRYPLTVGLSKPDDLFAKRCVYIFYNHVHISRVSLQKPEKHTRTRSDNRVNRAVCKGRLTGSRRWRTQGEKSSGNPNGQPRINNITYAYLNIYVRANNTCRAIEPWAKDYR